MEDQRGLDSPIGQKQSAAQLRQVISLRGHGLFSYPGSGPDGHRRDGKVTESMEKIQTTRGLVFRPGCNI